MRVVECVRGIKTENACNLLQLVYNKCGDVCFANDLVSENCSTCVHDSILMKTFKTDVESLYEARNDNPAYCLLVNNDGVKYDIISDNEL